MTNNDLLQSDLSLSEFKVATLMIILFIAVWFDIKNRKIPNLLILIGLCASLGIQLIRSTNNVPDWFFGLLVGFGLFIPMYLMRAMGAGDVKLMALVGSFLGTSSTIGATLIVLLAGGVLAIVVAFRNGTLQLAMENIRFHVIDIIFNVAQQRSIKLTSLQTSAGDLPYAVAITLGTLIQLILIWNGIGIFV